MQKNASFKFKHENQVASAGVKTNKVYEFRRTGCEVTVAGLTARRSCTGQYHWCLVSELAAKECSRQIVKVSGFHSLRVSPFFFLLTIPVVIVLAIRI
jgi:hypothetical protein